MQKHNYAYINLEQIMHIKNIFSIRVYKIYIMHVKLTMLNSQIILPLFVNHQQRGKQPKQKNFLPLFVRNNESTKGQ